MQSDYKIGSDPNKGCYEGKGNAKRFGDYKCRSPYVVEHSAVELIPSLRPNECSNKIPAFVLWTGDSVAMRGGKYSKDVIKYDLKNLTGVLKRLHTLFGGKVPVYPVLGNHDAYPQHQLPGKNYWVYDEVASLWAQFLPASAVKTLKEHGYYSLNINSELRLISLNTVLYYVNNKMCTSESDPGNQFEWLRKELGEAKKAGQVVYIAGHIPVRGSGGCFHTKFEKPFLEAMKGYHNIIMGSFWGHCHKDTFQLYGNLTTGDFHVAHLASTMVSGGERDPSFRWYIFDTAKKYAIQDWTTLYMDLPASNEKNKPMWNILYSAKQAYGIPDASAQSMHTMIKKMVTDNTLATKAHKFLHGGAAMGSCDATCQKQLTCVMLHDTTSGYEKCIKK